MGARRVISWWWYGSAGRPPRRVTGSVETEQTLPDGSHLTTKTASYTRGGDTVRTTRRYRLPDGSLRTESTTRTKNSPAVLAILGLLLGAFLVAWPWIFHLQLWMEILLSCLWYPVLLVLIVGAIAAWSPWRPGRLGVVVVAAVLVVVATALGLSESLQQNTRALASGTNAPSAAVANPATPTPYPPTSMPSATPNVQVIAAAHPYICEAEAAAASSNWSKVMNDWTAAQNIADGVGPAGDISDPWDYPMDFQASVAYLTLYDDAQNVDTYQLSHALPSAIASARQTYEADLQANSIYLGSSC